MASAKKFGTFGGVFTPSLLTILGVIMYLKLPWIVGHAGLWTTLGIILVAHVISISSGLSVASIATDKKVGSGGSYYIISRSLGLPIGGTLGWALFAGLSLSISLYLIGFTDVLLGVMGFESTIENIRLFGSLFLFGVLVITLISTSLTIKTQYLILSVVLLSLLSIFLGKGTLVATTPELSSLPESPSWITLFAIFFPAATGFQAGISMSGDLKNPGRSIPLGTILSIFAAMFIYIGLAVYLALTVDRYELINNPKVIFETALSPQLVIAGVLGATLSSALGSILAAPRILQAVAKDRIAPSFFGKGYGASNEPRNALIFSYLIAQGGILIGELDEVARIVSIFFIISYGFLNLTYAIESWASSDFRPSFKIPRSISVIGALFSLVLMIQLDLPSLLVAAVILIGLFFFLRSKESSLSSGDSILSLWLSVVKSGLLKLAKGDMKSRNWRPNIILFSGGADKRPHLPRLAVDLVGRLGIFTNFEIISDPTIESSAEIYLDKVYQEGGFITRRHRSKDLYEGIGLVSSVYGFSGFQPNTLMLGWPKEPLANPSFVTLLRNLTRHDFNIALLSYNAVKDFGNYKQVDFWWRGGVKSFSLALHLIRFLTVSTNWRRAEVRIFAIAPRATLNSRYHSTIEAILQEYRIKASVKVVNISSGSSEHSIIREESLHSDLTIVDIPLLGKETKEVITRTHTLASNLGTTLFINGQSSLEEIVPISTLLTIDKSDSLKIEQSNAVERASSSPLLTLHQHLEEPIKERVYQAVTQIDKSVENLFSSTISELIIKLNSYLNQIGEEILSAVASKKANFPTLKKSLEQFVEPSITELERAFKEHFFILDTSLAQLLSKKELEALLKKEGESVSILYNIYQERFTRLSELLRELIEEGTNEGNRDKLLTLIDQGIEYFEKGAQESKELMLSSLVETLKEAISILTTTKRKIRFNRAKKGGKRSAQLIYELEQSTQQLQEYINRVWSLFEYDLQYIELKLKIGSLLDECSKSIHTRLGAGILRQIGEIERHISESGSTQNINQFPLSFNIQNVENPLFTLNRSITQLLEELQESQTVIENGDKKTLYIRKPATYHIGNEVLSRIDRDSATLVRVISETLLKLKNLQKLSAFYTKSEDIDRVNSAVESEEKELSVNILEGLKRGKEVIEGGISKTIANLNEGYNLAFELLFSKEGVDDSIKVKRERKERERVRYFRATWQEIVEGGRAQLAKLLYNTSEGPIRFAFTDKGKLGSHFEGASSNNEILDLLPYYYLNLYRDRWGVNREFWVDIKGKLQEGNQAIEHFMFGRKGAILISGERGSGKSSLAKQLTESNFTTNRLVRVVPPREATSDITLFERTLFDALRAKDNFNTNAPNLFQGRESLDSLLTQIRERAVVVIEDIEMWWERKPEGSAVIDRVIELIQTYGRDLLFVITVNRHALKLIDSITSFTSWLSLNSESTPFSARMLKELILTRHKTGGLQLNIDGKIERQMREWDWARLFNRLFKLSGGNPREAINLWLASINNFADETIYLGTPVPFRDDHLAAIGKDELLILYQLVLHKRFSVEHLSTILLTDVTLLSVKLRELAQRDILIEESPSIYSINPTLYHSLVKKLTALELL